MDQYNKAFHVLEELIKQRLFISVTILQLQQSEKFLNLPKCWRKKGDENM